MSCPSESSHPTTLVVIGAVDDPLLRGLLSAGGQEPILVALAGTREEGRRLLTVAGGPGPVVYSPWPHPPAGRTTPAT